MEPAASASMRNLLERQILRPHPHSTELEVLGLVPALCGLWVFWFCFFFFFWEVYTLEIFKSFQFSSVAQLCLTLCETMDCSMPGFPVQLPELAQMYVHLVGDAIQPSHPLLSPSPHAFNLCQHQVFFQWVCSSHQMAKILEFQLQHQFFQWIFSTDFL